MLNNNGETVSGPRIPTIDQLIEWHPRFPRRLWAERGPKNGKINLVQQCDIYTFGEERNVRKEVVGNGELVCWPEIVKVTVKNSDLGIQGGYESRLIKLDEEFCVHDNYFINEFELSLLLGFDYLHGLVHIMSGQSFLPHSPLETIRDNGGPHLYNLASLRAAERVFRYEREDSDLANAYILGKPIKERQPTEPKESTFYFPVQFLRISGDANKKLALPESVIARIVGYICRSREIEETNTK